jgi:phenylacetate-CoA ligase
VTVVAGLRARLYAPRIRRAAAAHGGASADRRAERQLALLNDEWRRILARVPHYRDLHRAGALPETFGSLEEYRASVAPTTRAAVQQELERRTCDDRPPDAVRMTGGSTSRPVRIPAWGDEGRDAALAPWLGRSWYGVSPADPLFTIWGHGHLLGGGLRGRLAGLRRAGADRLLGYRRFPAYDLRHEALRRAADALLRFRPRWLVGYSVALDLFARANADRAAELRGLGLAMVAATAESFPDPGSAARLSELFGAPVAMEYGAVETGVVAHTHPQGGFRVFWNSYLVDAERTASGRHEVRITSLYPRSFPLVRYEIGDEIELDDPSVTRAVGLDRFARVVGRCNDYVPLGDGSLIHSEAFSHIMRSCPEVRAFQVAHGGSGISIRYVADRPLSAERTEQLRQRLARIHPGLRPARLERVDALPQTVAGKTRMVVAE